MSAGIKVKIVFFRKGLGADGGVLRTLTKFWNQILVVFALLVFFVGFQNFTVTDSLSFDFDSNFVSKGNRQIGIDMLAQTPASDFYTNVSFGKSAGASMLIFTLPWNLIEPTTPKDCSTPGTYVDPGNFLSILNMVLPTQNLKLSLTVASLSTNMDGRPTNLKSLPFNNNLVTCRYQKMMRFVFSKIPNVQLSSFQIANEIDIYPGTFNDNFWNEYISFLLSAKSMASVLRPGLKVGVIGTAYGALGQTENPSSRKGLRILNYFTDIASFTYYPMEGNFRVKDPSVVGQEITNLVGIYPDKLIAFNEIGYQTGSVYDGSSEAQQQKFITEIFKAWDKYSQQIISMTIYCMNDFSREEAQRQAAGYGLGTNNAFIEYLQTLGLRTFDGKPKLAFTQLKAEALKRGWFFTQLKIADIPARNGIFDPSLAADSYSQNIWMSYSAVNPSAIWPTQNYDVISTRLAYSQDKGATWIDSGATVNPVKDINLALPSPYNAGSWVNEVSSLVYDPYAPVEQRWKLMWMHYLIINAGRAFEHGWLALKMAASPEQLATAQEVKLFSGAAYNSANNILNGATGSPVGGAPKIALDRLMPLETYGCIWAEPGMMATAQGLYLSVNCARSSTDHRTMIFKCANPCNPLVSASWKLAGTALKSNDTLYFGADRPFAASNLVSVNSKYYLIVTTQNSMPFDGRYSDCYVFQFSDLDKADLYRDSRGAPLAVSAVKGDPGGFSGACTYSSSMPQAGIIFGKAYFGQQEKFRLYRTGISF